MYTAVSLVQARNAANAEKVGEAMKMHAEKGLEGQRRREKERQSENERQRHQGSGSGSGSGDGGSSTTGSADGGLGRNGAFVTRQGSMRLSGDLETDATRQATMLQKDNVLAHTPIRFFFILFGIGLCGRVWGWVELGCGGMP